MMTKRSDPDLVTFPQAEDEASFEAVRHDDEALRPGIDAICERHAVPQPWNPIRFRDGSLPVYAIGDDLVLKIYPPFEKASFETESQALGALAGRLPVPTPRVEAAGFHDGWGYLLMGRLRGQSLAEAWPRISPADRLRLSETLGESVAALHATDVRHLPTLAIDWSGFVTSQQARCVERQRGLGLPQAWLEQIPPFLDGLALHLDSRAVLLHTEVMREHLLASPGPHGWELTGLFDFEPATIGAPEYELASVGIFVSCAEPGLLGRFLRSYGYGEGSLDSELQSRALGWALLHRYSNLSWYLRRIPPRPEIATLAEIAGTWWAF